MSRKEYFAELHKKKMQSPEYRAEMAAKAAAYRAANPGVVSRQNAKRRAADPDKARRESREWFAANPDKRAAYEQNRRAKKREQGGRLSPGIKARLLALQSGKCAVCGVRLTKGHLDHVMPLALGGAHADANMQLLCQPCNQSKHAKHPVDFMQSKGFLL